MVDLSKKELDLKVKLEYPFNDKYTYTTQLTRINLDEERKADIMSGKGFIIDDPKGIKKEIKSQTGIYSIKYGATMSDVDSLNGRWRCKCGTKKGSIRHGEYCEFCNSYVTYKDDDISIFGYMVLKDYYWIIHPNMYAVLEAFIGADRLDRIIYQNIEVDQDGRIIQYPPNVKKAKDEPFAGIGMLEFKERYMEILDFYLAKYPNKYKYYEDLAITYKDLVFTHTIAVYSALLRPSELDSSGSLRYEKTNENYELLSVLVYKTNDDKLTINQHPKEKLQQLYDIQYQYNTIYKEIKLMMQGKKGKLLKLPILYSNIESKLRKLLGTGKELTHNKLCA